MSERSVFIRAVILAGAALCLLVFGWATGACYAPQVQSARCEDDTPRLYTRIERTRLCMGVPARIVVEVAKGDEPDAERVIERAFNLLDSHDRVMSDYRLDSDLSRVNAGAGGPPVKVRSDLIAVLTVGAEVSRASGGAFDATVGPASQLWRGARRARELPPQPEIDAARGLVDWHQVDLDPLAGTVRLARPGMRLDLGGIGKGFAVQRAVTLVRGAGFRAAMVALAGDIAVGDPPHLDPQVRAPGWNIEVSGDDGADDDQGGAVLLTLSCEAVSTSGDSQQFVEIGGRRYSHIVDPGTALGTPGGVAVTVIAPYGEWADALSTAAVVMLSRGKSDDEVKHMLSAFPGSRAIVERRGADGELVRTTIDPSLSTR